MAARYFDSGRDCEPPSATAPLICLSMALPLVCVAPAVVQQDKSNLAAIAPAGSRGAADDGRLTDRKRYGFDVGIGRGE